MSQGRGRMAWTLDPPQQASHTFSLGGPEALKSLVRRFTCIKSPVVVPQYMYSSSLSTMMHLTTRLMMPDWQSVARTFLSCGLIFHTRRFPWPPVTKESSSWLK
jgi:hypothetical protein